MGRAKKPSQIKKKLWEEKMKNTCKYLSCSAEGDSSITEEASRRALEALFSPSAAITLALASLEASASAAIARCSCSGKRASFLQLSSSP